LDRIVCHVEITKNDSRGRYARGFAYVVADDRGRVVDYGGDVLGGPTVAEGMDEVQKMAHQFISDSRQAKIIHKGKPIGEVVESVVVDDDLCRELGAITKRRGWWIGMRIDDSDVQKMLRDGKLKAFSIGGKGKRTKACAEDYAKMEAS
jgi:hypothetical protein